MARNEGKCGDSGREVALSVSYAQGEHMEAQAALKRIKVITEHAIKKLA
jgi:hypothetical protein